MLRTKSLWISFCSSNLVRSPASQSVLAFCSSRSCDDVTKSLTLLMMVEIWFSAIYECMWSTLASSVLHLSCIWLNCFSHCKIVWYFFLTSHTIDALHQDLLETASTFCKFFVEVGEHIRNLLGLKGFKVLGHINLNNLLLHYLIMKTMYCYVVRHGQRTDHLPEVFP